MNIYLQNDNQENSQQSDEQSYTSIEEIEEQKVESEIKINVQIIIIIILEKKKKKPKIQRTTQCGKSYHGLCKHKECNFLYKKKCHFRPCKDHNHTQILCPDIVFRKRCPNPDACDFSHTQIKQKEFCKYFIHGIKCKRGDQCKYLHQGKCEQCEEYLHSRFLCPNLKNGSKCFGKCNFFHPTIDCHFFQHGICKFQNCRFKHEEPSTGKCLNLSKKCKQYPHSMLLCPDQEKGQECKDKDQCDYFHEPKLNNLNCHFFQEKNPCENKECMFKHEDEQTGKCLNLEFTCMQQQHYKIKCPDEQKGKFTRCKNELLCDYKHKQYCHFFQSQTCQLEDKCFFTHEKQGKQNYCKNFNNCSIDHQQFFCPQEQQEGACQLVGECDYFHPFKLFSTCLKDLNQCLKDINHPKFRNYIEKLKLQSIKLLQIRFIVDCTSSMREWINNVKDCIKNVSKEIKNQYPTIQIQFSFIGYRDFDDKPQFDILDFTDNINEFQNFVNKVTDKGGADVCEDVTGGLEQALKGWNEDNQISKLAVLIFDAPTHGKYYHNLGSNPKIDNHHDKIQKGSLEQQIKQFAKLNINFSVIQLKQITEQMCQMMKNEYEQQQNNFKMKIKNNINELSLDFSVIKDSLESIHFSKVSSTYLSPEVGKLLNEVIKDKQMIFQKNTGSIDSYFLNSKSNIKQSEENQKIKEKQECIPIVEIDYDDENLTSLRGKFIFEYFPSRSITSINYYKPYLLNSQSDELFIQTMQKPFAKGGMRYVYAGSEKIQDILQCSNQKNNKKNKNEETKQNEILSDKLIDFERKIVLKVPQRKDEVADEYSIKNDQKQLIIADHLAQRFNKDQINNFDESDIILLNYVPCCIFKIADGNKFSGQQYIYVEYQIDKNQEKWNNNIGGIILENDKKSQIIQCFSHYTWQKSFGYLIIVVDIQGSKEYLTDLAIHSLVVNQYTKTDFGFKGHLLFFITHVCNKYCKKLNLIDPNNQKNLPENFSFMNDFIIDESQANKQINFNCSLCMKEFKSTNQKYQELVKKDFKQICEKCQDNMKYKEIKKCSKCYSNVQQRPYYLLMKRSIRDTRCKYCAVFLNMKNLGRK